MPRFYEFFAGGGMARAGLGPGWECLFANDIDPKKGASYAANWGCRDLRIEDVGALTTADLPGVADLAWASFPCQDLSLAGDYAGLKGKRSGTFWLFWRLMEALVSEGRAPSIIVLENVCGALTSHHGRDFGAIGGALARAGYLFGAMVIDAKRFLPQSRPRLFIVAVRATLEVNPSLKREAFDPLWHPANLVRAYEKLPTKARSSWIWWSLPTPPSHAGKFSDVIEDEPLGVEWHTQVETRRILRMMSALNREKVDLAIKAKRRVVGGIYKRTRLDDDGERAQRAEVRFDDVAGCLRTPVGGSSRQLVMVVEKGKVRTRLLAPREAARLMGLDDTYILPGNYNEAYHLVGDGVAVPVVRHLTAHILEPLLAAQIEGEQEAA